MRVLILCELFPLVHGTQALQMAKVASALEKHVAIHGMPDELFIVSGVAAGRQAEADAWVNAAEGKRAALPYTPLVSSSRVLAPAASGLHYAVRKLSHDASFVHRACRLARAIIDRFAPDVVLTVATPLVWHQVGLALAAEMPRLSWIAFFADPRPLALLPPPYRRRRLKTYFQLRFCRRVLSSADAIIAPNRYMLEWMETCAGANLRGRKHVIPHCGLRAAQGTSTGDLDQWLVHAGSLFARQLSWDLLQAIKSTAERHSQRFRGLTCVGSVPGELFSMIRSLEMEPMVRVVGRVSPEKAVSIIASAGANLLADAPLDTGYFLHSKFADYAINERPILVVGPERCPMRDYLEAYGGGLAVTHRQADIERALERIFAGNHAPPARPPRVDAPGPLARRFSPETIAGHYFRVFEQHAARTRRTRRLTA